MPSRLVIYTSDFSLIPLNKNTGLKKGTDLCGETTLKSFFGLFIYLFIYLLTYLLEYNCFTMVC